MLKLIKRAFQKATYIKKDNWDFYLKFFPWIERGAVLFRTPIIKKIVKKAAMLDSEDKHFSQGYIIPLNKDLNYQEKYKNVVLPYTLLENIIKDAGYTTIMNKCYCRDSLKCKTYGPDVGCIMIGDGAKKLVKSGVAYEVTTEKALAHLDKAADMGLIAMALWIELEAFGMGLTDEEHYKLIEICLCCPCCCVGMRNFHKWGNDIMKRFESIGWTASSKEGCNACRSCEKACPMETITVNENPENRDESSITVGDRCIGCGICASKCKKDAIEMIQTIPFKDKMQDYFWGFKPEIQ